MIVRFSRKQLGSLGGRRVFVEDGHQCAGHCGGVRVLDDVAAIHDPARALLKEIRCALQDDLVRDPATAANEHGDTACCFDDFMID